eukprot:230114_1
MGVFNDTSLPSHIVLHIFLNMVPIILSLVLLISLIYHFATHKKKIRMELKLTAVVGIVSFISTLSCYFVADGFQYDVFWGRESYAMVSLFWGHGNASAYLLFVQRIKTVFGPTQHNPSHLVYIFFYVCIFLVYFCQMYIVVFLLLLLDSDIDPQFALNNINIANAFEIFVQLILSSSLIYIFVHKLHQIVIAFSNLKHESITDLKGDKKKNASRILRVATKQTLLSSCAAVTTCGWLIFAAIMDVDWIFYPQSDMNNKYLFHFLTGISITLDCTVNSLAIFLSFSFSDKYYTKLCSTCDGLCVSQCENSTKTQIEQHMVESQQQQPTSQHEANGPNTGRI